MILAFGQQTFDWHSYDLAIWLTKLWSCHLAKKYLTDIVMIRPFGRHNYDLAIWLTDISPTQLWWVHLANRIWLTQLWSWHLANRHLFDAAMVRPFGQHNYDLAIWSTGIWPTLSWSCHLADIHLTDTVMTRPFGQQTFGRQNVCLHSHGYSFTTVNWLTGLF